MRLGHVGYGCRWRLVAPGAGGVEFGFQLWVMQVFGDPLANEFCVPMGVQGLHHVQANEDGIHASPWLRAVMEKTKLRGQPMLILREKEVHAARVLLIAM